MSSRLAVVVISIIYPDRLEVVPRQWSLLHVSSVSASILLCYHHNKKYSADSINTQRIRSRFNGGGMSGGGAVSAPPNDDGAT